MKNPIEVRLVGPTLLCQAMEALLATVSPIYMESSVPGEIGEEGMLRRRNPQGAASLTVVLLIGEGWQQRVAAEARGQRRTGMFSASTSGSHPTQRYALIADGSKIDFYGARKMAVNAFIGTDEPVSVLVQGIQAAAQNRLYCSPQLLPSLIDAVGSTAAPAGLAEVTPERPSEPAPATVMGGDNVKPAAQAALLSGREHEVALHAARGLSNEQIAVFLGISVPTVKFHLMHAFRKLQIQRRTQLYAFMPFLTSATEALLPPNED